MVGTIINHVPRLLKAQKKTVMQVIYDGRLAPATAYAWANPEKLPTSIDVKTLARLCDVFGVGVGEILEYLPEKKK